MAEVINIVSQKGGVGKTATAFNLGIGLVREGKRVLLVDIDPQCSLTKICGLREQENIQTALHDVILKQLNGQPLEPGEGIYTGHKEGIHIVPSKKELTALESALNEIEGGTTALKQYVDTVKTDYDYVIIDAAPTLATLSVSGMAASDKLIIPVQPYYEPVAGMEELLDTYMFVRQSGLNPNLQIGGLLFTMVEGRVRFSNDIMELVEGEYGKHVKIFSSRIPRSVKVAEMSAASKSIFCRSKNKAALAYGNLTKEVLGNVREYRKEHTAKRDEPVI